MARVSVFRKEHFNAAHRLNNPDWDEARNIAIFGKCNRPNYHGHNYELIVKLTGEPDPDLGEIVAAAVVVAPDSPVTVAELRSFAAEHLAYFEVPTAWWFRDPLPVNASGNPTSSSPATYPNATA